MANNGFENVEEVAAKVDWEGGVTSAILGYGLGAVCLPSDAPQEVRNAWLAVEAIADDVDIIRAWLDTADLSGTGW